MERAVVDRIVAGIAVVLVGESETEYQVPVSTLPDGARAGSWLRVVVGDMGITAMSIDAEETANVQSRIEEKLNRLRQRGRGYN